MPRGGARRNSGPAPDPTALRRQHDGKDWTRLPASGLTAAQVPAWPAHLPDHEGKPDPVCPADPTQPQRERYERDLAAAVASRAEAMERNERERDYWQRLWTGQPQAHVWLADGTEDVVALFVRQSIEAGAPGGAAGARQLVKQLASDLLLNTAALYSARYVIDRAMQGTAGLGLDPAADKPAQGSKPARRGGPSVRDGLTIVPPPPDDDDTD